MLIAFGARRRRPRWRGRAGAAASRSPSRRLDAEWEFAPPTDDPFVRQELAETLYHVLWELVHVFFDHRGLLEGREARRCTTPARRASSTRSWPRARRDLEAVVEDVRRSVLMKAAEVGALREQTLGRRRRSFRPPPRPCGPASTRGGTLLALGNGGSATDAMDAVADLRSPPGGWPAHAAIDLTEDPAILTAVANDVGVEAIFQRQVIAYGARGRRAARALHQRQLRAT